MGVRGLGAILTTADRNASAENTGCLVRPLLPAQSLDILCTRVEPEESA